jgi:hypothetical protein
MKVKRLISVVPQGSTISRHDGLPAMATDGSMAVGWPGKDTVREVLTREETGTLARWRPGLLPQITL